MNLIKLAPDNVIPYLEIISQEIFFPKINIQFLFMTNEEANQKWYILKEQINNNIQIVKDNIQFNLILNECYLDSNKIIMKGQFIK